MAFCLKLPIAACRVNVNRKYSGETLMFASAICPFSNGLAILFISLLALQEKLNFLCDILA